MSLADLINYFDRSFIINLPERKDRRQETVKEFARVGLDIPCDRIEFHPAFRPDSRGQFYSIGARGTFFSHRQVLQEAIRARLNNVLIFEDDVSFKEGAANATSLLKALKSEPWDIVYFGYLSPDPVASEGPLCRWYAPIIGAHFYAVNGHFLPRLVHYMDLCESRPEGHPLGGPSCRDGVFNHFRCVENDIVTMLAVPNLGAQRSSRSDVTSGAWDQTFLTAPLAKVVRKVKNLIR